VFINGGNSTKKQSSKSITVWSVGSSVHCY